MSNHEYSPAQAFNTLMEALDAKDSELADRIRDVVNEGKDTVLEDRNPRQGKRPARTYRQTVPYTHEEALDVAMGILEAVFSGQPGFVQSCLDNMDRAELGMPRHGWARRSEAESESGGFGASAWGTREVEFEPTEKPSVARRGAGTFVLSRLSDQSLTELAARIQRLRDLVMF